MTPEDLKAAREYVRAKARFLCGGAKGRGKLDPVYVDTTQGRDTRVNWTHYSSCGDLLHGMAWHLNVREEWVNRDDSATGRKWTFGTQLNGGRDNISTLQGRKGFPGPAIVTPIGYLPEAGDYLLCWHDDGSGVHVRIAGNTEAGILETFDYGAGGMSNSEFPGASSNHLHISTSGGKLFLETIAPAMHVSKRVQKVVPLPILLALSKGLPSMTGEEIDALEKSVP